MAKEKLARGIAARYCDLVMKGGITSGIVYPAAVLALTERYVFRNIGGTSAGAIAAAATAAAAAGERRKLYGHAPDTAGFAAFRKAADELKQDGTLFGLFQPAAGTGPLFRFALKIVAADKTKRVGAAIAAAPGLILRAAPAATLAAFVLFLAIGWAIGGGWPGAAAALLPALIVGALAGAIATILSGARAIRKAHFGMCQGLTLAGAEKTGLSDWLHETIQAAGGVEGRPMRFSDLWDAPQSPEEMESEIITSKTVSLEMITTDLSHRQPRTLPLEGARLWFDRKELALIFPDEVMKYLTGFGDPREGSPDYYPLPTGGDMPLVVATRMSLSFPILLSAIPLYEEEPDGSQIDRGAGPREAGVSMLASVEELAQSTGGAAGAEELARQTAPRRLRRCWFSDGGLSSNLPIHLFDAPLPRWPTFAIDLTRAETDADRPTLGAEDRIEPAPHHPIRDGWAVGEIAAFLLSMIATMQRWRDQLQARAPGQRGRIVRVPLTDKEGGFNLDMDTEVLKAISLKGTAAGDQLKTFQFAPHRHIRWRILASAEERFAIAFRKGAGDGSPPAPPAAGPYAFSSEAQREDADGRFKDLAARGEEWGPPERDVTEGSPTPLLQLRISPTF